MVKPVKNPTPLESEITTFRLVAQCFNKLHHHAPPNSVGADGYYQQAEALGAEQSPYSDVKI
jgi:hypothetical protein